MKICALPLAHRRKCTDILFYANRACLYSKKMKELRMKCYSIKKIFYGASNLTQIIL